MIPSLSSWGFRRTLLRIIGGLALALGLVGCSMVKLGYNNLPEVAYWWLDGYVDFSEAQAPRAREALARLQQWHRSEELPRYVQWLREAEGLAGGDIGPAQACALVVSPLARALLDHLRTHLPATSAAAPGPQEHRLLQVLVLLRMQERQRLLELLLPRLRMLLHRPLQSCK